MNSYTNQHHYRTLTELALRRLKHGDLETAKRIHTQALLLREEAYRGLPGGYRGA